MYALCKQAGQGKNENVNWSARCAVHDKISFFFIFRKYQFAQSDHDEYDRMEDTLDPTPGVSFTEYLLKNFHVEKNMIRTQVDGGQIEECQFPTSLT